MSIEIPDAAVEAAKQASWGHSRATYQEILEAALPHLRAAILEDLRERCEQADRELKQMAVERKEHGIDREAARIHGKAEGVRLALSYIGDAERTGQ
ncbi:hypothetical protein [Kineosporia babensis]|uniref:Uncharacterized protein n=1 Tax=Kineosporia babensis TaxID=499548 RepID=A0A9X1NBY7_9ACTN|nr:hypothetical protein [Kineosporia babensis]MCD5310875.1 hypothetical protein [Kineosporia babensis]